MAYALEDLEDLDSNKPSHCPKAQSQCPRSSAVPAVGAKAKGGGYPCLCNIHCQCLSSPYPVTFTLGCFLEIPFQVTCKSQSSSEKGFIHWRLGIFPQDSTDLVLPPK